ncbi:hypothetical protein LSH36_166g05000 [Paralvinella palmiformis]|uniref:Large ribosomal subunit protein eL22 n=1 Tax=Paralvinella palmiformis TaxID=53620 RepID=A0AAD9JT44_9ANNE|nr:hypothetical protein LSH36_166g05000 [Paralvinella palmiformis]
MAPAQKKLALKKGKGKRVKLELKYTVDCTHPVEDGILDCSSFKSKIVVTSEIPFSKRYLKYLTKKYLKKHSLRDWLRVVANNKDSYELRYFQINNEEEEEDEDNE